MVSCFPSLSRGIINSNEYPVSSIRFFSDLRGEIDIENRVAEIDVKYIRNCNGLTGKALGVYKQTAGLCHLGSRCISGRVFIYFGYSRTVPIIKSDFLLTPLIKMAVRHITVN
jgi:hypothetical protein